MKKKKVWIGIGCALVCILLLVGGTLYRMRDNGIGMMEGTCLMAENGSYMIVDDRSPYSATVMSQRMGEKGMFEGLQTGDRIQIVCGPIMETYPARVGVYCVRKIGHGWKIPEETIKSLEELGWNIIQ